MKLAKKVLSLGFIFISFCTNMLAAADRPNAPKTLKRWVDPVVMEGKLGEDLIGAQIENVRLYSFHDGKFTPIRYQIDEMTADRDWVFPDGPLPNEELANGKLDLWDTLIFMVNDLGDRVSKDVWMARATKGEEIEIIDPLTGEKGWCYLLFFASDPPGRSKEPDYIHYDYETELYGSDYFTVQNIITNDGLHSTYYKHVSVPEKSGGSGKNFVDRMKIRMELKMLYGAVQIKTHEELLKSNVLAYKKGPIRFTRRVEQYRKLPGGLKALRVVTDPIHYRNTCTTPVMFNVPFRMDSVLSSAIVRFGTDYSENAIGAKVSNSTNPKGFAVDGKMDDGEENFSSEFDTWRLLTGNLGTFITRTLLTPEIKENIHIKMGLIDDITQEYPPESNPGSIGYLWQDWDIGKLKRGKYYLFLEFCYPPHYKKGDETQYVNYLDHPLKISVENQEGKNQLLLLPNVGKKYL